MKSSKKPKIYGLLLSAGLSSRMGKFKPLINYNGKSFVQNIVLRLNSVCEKIIIVTGFNKTEVEDNLNQLKTANIEFVFNPEFEKGMSTSLKTGLKLAVNSNWILYHFIDQPGLYDPIKMLAKLKEVGFNGMIMPGHVPKVEGDGPWKERSRAYTIGYIKGIMAALKQS